MKNYTPLCNTTMGGGCIKFLIHPPPGGGEVYQVSWGRIIRVGQSRRNYHDCAKEYNVDKSIIFFPMEKIKIKYKGVWGRISSCNELYTPLH